MYSLLFFRASRRFSHVTSLIIARVEGSRVEQTLLLRLRPLKDGAELSERGLLLYNHTFDCQDRCYSCFNFYYE